MPGRYERAGGHGCSVVDTKAITQRSETNRLARRAAMNPQHAPSMAKRVLCCKFKPARVAHSVLQRWRTCSNGSNEASRPAAAPGRRVALYLCLFALRSSLHDDSDVGSPSTIAHCLRPPCMTRRRLRRLLACPPHRLPAPTSLDGPQPSMRLRRATTGTCSTAATRRASSRTATGAGAGCWVLGAGRAGGWAGAAPTSCRGQRRSAGSRQRRSGAFTPSLSWCHTPLQVCSRVPPAADGRRGAGGALPSRCSCASRPQAPPIPGLRLCCTPSPRDHTLLRSMACAAQVGCGVGNTAFPLLEINPAAR